MVSANAFYPGHDENFYEWASSNIIIATYGLTSNDRQVARQRDVQPPELQPPHGRKHRRQQFGFASQAEYQIARPVFVRLVGEYDSFYRERCGDEGRTGRPILGTAGAQRPSPPRRSAAISSFPSCPTRARCLPRLRSGLCGHASGVAAISSSVESPLQRVTIGRTMHSS